MNSRGYIAFLKLVPGNVTTKFQNIMTLAAYMVYVGGLLEHS